MSSIRVDVSRVPSDVSGITEVESDMCDMSRLLLMYTLSGTVGRGRPQSCQHRMIEVGKL